MCKGGLSGVSPELPYLSFFFPKEKEVINKFMATALKGNDQHTGHSGSHLKSQHLGG